MSRRVPKLRFKEFSGEWEEKRLEKVYDFYPTNSFSRDKLNYEKGTVKNIHYGDIHTKFSTLFDITKELVPFINNDIDLTRLKKESYCLEGDLIFADASEDVDDIGKSIELINLNNEKVLSGLHTLLARQKEKQIVKGFAGYLFKSNYIREQIKKEAQGAKVLGISAKRLSNIKLLFPKDPNEQQKIANTLSSLDNLIEAQEKKVEALKKHKKGLMQQLFPQEGEKIPKLRFKEFSGEWELLPIGKKIDFVSGFAFKGIDISEDSSGVPLLRGINITEGKIRHNNDIDRYLLDKNEDFDKFKLQEGDLVIAMDGSKVGKNVALITSSDAGAILVQRVARLRSNDFVLIQFLFQHINSKIFQNYVERINTSSGIPHISEKQIKDFQIFFPSKSEQEKIANTLSSLDNLIEAQEKKVEALKKHKKGLMQQMFVSKEK